MLQSETTGQHSTLRGLPPAGMEDFGKDEIHHRHFFHILCGGDPPNQWQHDETDPSDSGSSPIHFEFFWAEMPDKLPELICDHGIMLPMLEKWMSQDNQVTP